jgi:hypothetical protein
MAMLVIDGLTVNCSINGGIGSRVESLEDIDRSIAGSILRTQMSSTALASKEILSCRTIPLTTADRNTLVTKLQSAATLPVTGDIGPRTVAAVITSKTPMTVAGGVRRWIVSFDLIEA